MLTLILYFTCTFIKTVSILKEKHELNKRSNMILAKNMGTVTENNL